MAQFQTMRIILGTSQNLKVVPFCGWVLARNYGLGAIRARENNFRRPLQSTFCWIMMEK